MNLLTVLHALGWRQPTTTTAAGIAIPPSEDPTEPGWRCGWFDSSHELQRGLCVREHASAADLGADLPLGPWLDLHLSGWQPAAHT
jgi:hypothetical protein